MFLSMHNWMRAEPIEVTIRRLAKYGYASIEIEGLPQKYDPKEVRRLLKEYGLFCNGSVTLMFEGRDLIHADEAVRARSIQYVKDCVTLVKELDSHKLSVVPSQVGKLTALASEAEEWNWAVESLKEIYDYSEKAGVVLGLEAINRYETYFINRHDQALLLAEAVGPNCGVCLDAFHINFEEADPWQAILNSRERLVGFHVADNNRMPCGLGSYDWVRLVTTLKAAGYNDALMVEFVMMQDHTPANFDKNALPKAATELTPEQLKYIKELGSAALSDECYNWLVEMSAKTLKTAIEKVGAA